MTTASKAKGRRAEPAAGSTSVLLIDDEADTLLPPLAQWLEPRGFAFKKETNAARALDKIRSSQPSLILLDLHFPGDDQLGGQTTGGKLLTKIRKRFQSIPVLVFTTRLEQLDIPLEAFEEPPHGQYAKPDFSRDRTWVDDLAGAMQRTIDTAAFSSDPDVAHLDFMVGQTKEMHDVVGLVQMAAKNVLNVTIYGESGTGKQLVAKAIHKLSGRTGSFQYLNSREADGTELQNALQAAQGGTLYLDSIQHLSMPLQHRLLEVAEAGRLGLSNPLDVRLIAATNHSLKDLVADEVLRADLAQSLTTLLITLPSLRQRQDDFPAFFERFVAQANESLNKHVQVILRPETLDKLKGHNWPGNIRELETTITRAVATTGSNIILPDDIQLNRAVWTSPMPDATQTAKGQRYQFLRNLNRAVWTSPIPDATQTAELQTSEAESDPVIVLTDELESLDKDQRYQFLRSQKDMDLRASVLIEFICRLRQQTGKRVSHTVLAGAIHPVNRVTDYDTVRQFVCTALKHRGLTLTTLECNL